jgi:putative membrane protein
MIPDSVLPSVNASLNFLSSIFLVLGFVAIKRGERARHTTLMTLALASSAIFLTCYLAYHYQVGSVKYPFMDWTRPIYFFLLVPHVILAAVMTPFIFYIVWKAYGADFERHKKLARIVWPVWMFVSTTGVIVYLMLYGRYYMFGL